MGATWRKFTLKYRTEAFYRVIDTGTTPRGLAKSGRFSRTHGANGRAANVDAWRPSRGLMMNHSVRELLLLRRHVVEEDVELAFQGKSAVYLAANPPGQRDLP